MFWSNKTQRKSKDEKISLKLENSNEKRQKQMQHENENEIRWSLRNYQLKLFYSKPKCHLFKTHTLPHSSQSRSKQHSTKQLRCTLWQPKLDFPCTINQLNNPSDLRKRSRINWYLQVAFKWSFCSLKITIAIQNRYCTHKDKHFLWIYQSFPCHVTKTHLSY